jgi:hypothetical protein
MTDQEIKEALAVKVENEWSEYKKSLLSLGTEELIRRAGEIVHMEECRNELVSGDYNVEDMAYLLHFKNPLEIVSGAWDGERSNVSAEEFGHTLWEIRDRGYADANCECDPNYILTENIILKIHPASHDEDGLFYALPPEKDAELGAIGHVRIDFGRSGKEWHSTWWPRGPEELKTETFKTELTEVIDAMRENVLKDMNSMVDYCWNHGTSLLKGQLHEQGFVLESEHYRYCLRCILRQGDYNAYLTCYDKQVQEMNMTKPIVGRLTFANGDVVEFTDPDKYVAAFKEELDYMATTGMTHETLTGAPEVRKAIDDAIYNLYGEENPRPLSDYQQMEPKGPDMKMGGI